MKIDCVKNIKVKRRRRVSEINFHVNDNHHAHEIDLNNK